MEARRVFLLLCAVFLVAVLAPLQAADTFDWTNVGDRAFAVEVPRASDLTPPDTTAVHEWRVLITFATAPLPAEEPQFLFIPPGSNGAVIGLPHVVSYDGGDANVDFRKNTSTEYALWVVYPLTGTGTTDRVGSPGNTRRWVVVIRHPNAAGGGTYGSITITVRHRNVLSNPATAWLNGKVFLNDPPAPAITPPAELQVYNLAGAAAASVDVVGGFTDSLDKSWYPARTYAYDWSPTDLSGVADPPPVSWGAGVYSVSLTVEELLKDRDPEADVYQTGTRQVTVVVKQPPAAAFTADPADEIISFDASFDGTASSANAPAGALTDLNYHWDYDGNGSEDGATTDPMPPAYHFSTPGVYPPTLKVVDAYGLESSPVSREVVARDRLGLPQAGWVPGAAPRPVIDGVLDGDNGWAGAYRQTYDMSAGNPPVAFRASKEQAESSSQPYLYLAFEVQSSTFDADDAVVLAFAPQRSGSAPALDRRLVFYPFASGPAGGTVSPEVWKDSGAWGTDPGWSVDNLQAVSKANGTSWVLEMRIPTQAGVWGGAHWIDLANQFLFYFSVVEVGFGGTATATIYNWPKESEEISGNIDTYDYLSKQWGVVDKADGALSNGVYLERAHFGTRNDPISTILLSSPNTFFAEPENLTGRGGTSVTANDVSMSVRIANWGLPPADFSLWERIITDADLTNIPAGATGVLEALWEVPDDKEEQYRQHPHQCIHVELDSAGDAVFAIRSIARNMDFVEGSSFRRKAEISGRGYGEPPAGERQHRFLIKISRQVRPVDPVGRKSAGGKPGRGSSELTWTADGFRETGRTIIIHNHPYQVVDAIGSFGYVVRHEGPVARWKDCLAGSLKKLDKDLYAVKVAPETARLLRTVAWPLEYAWSTAAGAGLVKMLGNRATDYDLGYAGFAGAAYPLLPWLELLLRGSYLYFPVSSTGTADTSMFWFTGAARLRLELGRSLALFAGAGPGIGLEGGATLLGFEGHGGLEMKVLPVLMLELGADYRATFDLATQMAGAYAAVVWRF